MYSHDKKQEGYLLIYVWQIKADKGEVLVPLLSGQYRTYSVGTVSSNKAINKYYAESSWLVIDKDSIDFNRCFYVNKVIQTNWGEANFDEHISDIMITNMTESAIKSIQADTIKESTIGFMYALYFPYL